MSFKFGTIVCFVTLLLANPGFAQNRTTVLGEIDPAADARLLHLLERPADRLPVPDSHLLTIPAPGAVALPLRTMSASVDEANLWLMLLVGCGLIAFHLRRKQKSLRFRPLTEAVYR